MFCCVLFELVSRFRPLAPWLAGMRDGPITTIAFAAKAHVIFIWKFHFYVCVRTEYGIIPFSLSCMQVISVAPCETARIVAELGKGVSLALPIYWGRDGGCRFVHLYMYQIQPNPPTPLTWP